MRPLFPVPIASKVGSQGHRAGPTSCGLLPPRALLPPTPRSAETTTSGDPELSPSLLVQSPNPRRAAHLPPPGPVMACPAPPSSGLSVDPSSSRKSSGPTPTPLPSWGLPRDASTPQNLSLTFPGPADRTSGNPDSAAHGQTPPSPQCTPCPVRLGTPCGSGRELKLGVGWGREGTGRLILV